MLILFAALAISAPLRGPEGVPTDREVDGSTLFGGEASLPASATLRSDPIALGQVARNTACYLQSQRFDVAAGPGLVPTTRIQLQRTLWHIAATAQTSPASLRDPAWLAANFRAVSWKADGVAAKARGLNPPADTIRLTRYLIYQVPGSTYKTAEFNAALYAVPTEERALTEAEAQARPLSSLVRSKLTRKQVLDGAFMAGGSHEGQAEPLVWVARADVHRALMQGTIEVEVSGSKRLFNVHRNNGIIYKTGVKNSEDQDRFWYFREVDGLNGWSTAEGSIQVLPEVTVAGDVYNLGLGRVFALGYSGATGPELRLTVLADTGGAFQPNLFQLDWLAGSYPSHTVFEAAVKHVPAYVNASVLVVRDGVEVRPIRCD